MKKILFKAVLCVVLFAASKISFSQDSYDNTKTAIKNMYEYIDNNKIEDAVALVEASAVDHTPFPGQKQGAEGFRDIITMLRAAFPDFSQEIVETIVSPDGTRACILAKMKGTQKGDFMGIPATGNKIDVLATDIMIFKNGKVTDHWGFIDSETMMKQLGISK